MMFLKNLERGSEYDEILILDDIWVRCFVFSFLFWGKFEMFII